MIVTSASLENGKWMAAGLGSVVARDDYELLEDVAKYCHPPVAAEVTYFGHVYVASVYAENDDPTLAYVPLGHLIPEFEVSQ